jgi:hypothetical protein
MDLCRSAWEGRSASEARARQSYLESSAHFSRCGCYRYALMRRIGPGERVILFIGLNPSTADTTQDDPTIRRFVGFARRMCYDVVWVANLFAWRATDPTQLKRVSNPVGPRNGIWLHKLVKTADTLVAAWGNGAALSNRPTEVLQRFGPMHCFGQTALGHPRHPLYLPGTTSLVQFSCSTTLASSKLCRAGPSPRGGKQRSVG